MNKKVELVNRLYDSLIGGKEEMIIDVTILLKDIAAITLSHGESLTYIEDKMDTLSTQLDAIIKFLEENK